MVRSLWVCQNTMDSLLESRRILVGLVVDKARQGVSQDWRTGRAPPTPFCFLRMCSTLILDKQHLGHVKRIVADYFPTPTLNANDGERGRMNVYPLQTLPQLNINAQVNAGAVKGTESI
ncbi:hypothetical protein Ocin01_17520 [Orchesella cincta]|uniref:Uncharacterized protein n=1 Tax=Orchesella cincta TaxID=48709 RepID=A0A1D2M8B2_ORCCI|nr:hypothetical protein Ocin01_17520 [Orchesella cincta]